MTDANFLALGVDRTATASLSDQLYQALRDKISTGAVSADARLPASRPLAQELGISRATVVTAYDQLIAEGYAEARHGSGVRVCDIGAMASNPKAASSSHKTTSTSRPQQTQTFRPGQPDMRLFPVKEWGRTVARVARSQTFAMVDGGGFGDLRLRTAISQHLAEWRGVTAPPERILVTAGSGDALEITIRALAKRGDRVALEDPGYVMLRSFVESLGLVPQWLDVGSAGAIPPTRRADPVTLSAKLTVLTPSHEYPMGGAIPTATRLEFLRLAKATQGWIVEDDFDSEYRYAGRPIPALASLDTQGRVIYVGSFSKVLSTSIRLGFMVIPDAVMDAYTRTLRTFGPRASVTPQRPLALFMEDGGFHRHVRRMRRIYGQRRRVFMNLVHTHLSDLVTFEDHQAGMQVALRLPDGTDDAAIADAAASQAGLSVPPLSAFCARPLKLSGLLAGFCSFTEEEMTVGMPKLRSAIIKVT